MRGIDGAVRVALVGSSSEYFQKITAAFPRVIELKKAL